MRTLLSIKSYSLHRYLQAFKRAQRRCSECHVPLARVTLLMDGALLSKAQAATLSGTLTAWEWRLFKTRLTVLCRFCAEIRVLPPEGMFDLVGFKQYLFLHTGMRRTSVHEYVIRLRRLGHLLEQAAPTVKVMDVETLDGILESDMPATTVMNYTMALRRYQDYQRWRAG